MIFLLAGLRPRRTLVFCSWDAEEEGLMGSIEWVEVCLFFHFLCEETDNVLYGV